MKKFCSVISFIVLLCVSAFAQDSGVNVLEKPRPQYTSQASKNNSFGDVTLSVEFRGDGTIGTISVVGKPLGDGLTESATAAARKIKFEPARVNGVPISVTKDIEYSFDISLDDDFPDVRTKLKIIKGPIFRFDAVDEKVLGYGKYKIEIFFSRRAVPSIVAISPKVSDYLRKKFEEAITAIIFEPAKVEDGRKVSIVKAFDYTRSR